MAVEAPEQAPEVTQAPDETVDRLFRYSGWVHVGPGADGCEAIDEGTGANDCSNPTHFHAWCRLPNQIQHEEIREKALAAKGRRRRQLLDPATDAYDALEGALDDIAAQGDPIKESLIVELLQKERLQEYVEAAREVMEMEEGAGEDDEPLKPFEHIQTDTQRFEELASMPEEDRPRDEYDELRRHLERYNDLCEAKRDEVHKPKVDALMALDLSALVDKVRQRRVEVEAGQAFMLTYSRSEWLICTYAFPNGPRRFRSMEELTEVAPEVYEGLRSTFDDLEQAQNEVVSGNS